MKRFNTAAACLPSEHYMADLSERVREIKKMVDDEKYFTITRPGQYGKTTILCALKNVLEKTMRWQPFPLGRFQQRTLIQNSLSLRPFAD